MLSAQTPPQELWQGVLDTAGLQQYHADLMDHAEMLGIQAKRSQQEMSDANHVLSLDQALRGISDGRFRAIQLCYSYDNRVWCDTLIRQAHSYTLIRTY